MAILLSDAELDGLYGLPSLPFRVYVQSIRRRMDFRTGMVGQAYRISYQAIKEDIYTEPAPGRVREPVSTDQLFRAVRVLEAAGLIAIRSVMAAKRLVFQCLLAETLSNVQNKPATNPRLEPATVEATNGKGFDHMAATVESTKAATHRRSELTSSTRISSSSSTESVARGPQGGRDETPDLIAPQGGANGPLGADQPELDKNQPFALEVQEKASSEGKALFFPSGLSTDQRQAVELRLAKQGDKAQLLLDELAGWMASRTILNPVRYLGSIIESAKDPGWFAEMAGPVREARERAFAVELARAGRPASAPAVAVPKGSPMPEEMFRDFLKRKGK